jgi:hypothetical protein
MRVMSIMSDNTSSGSSPLRGFALFIVSGVVAAGCWWGWGSLRNWGTEPTSAPNCYWADEAYVPQNLTMPLMGTPDRNGVPNNRRRMGNHDLEKVFAAEKICKPGACTPDAAKEYRSALLWYLEPRLQHIRQLDMVYGDNGLRLARTIYSDALDLQIEKGVRDRYQAKAFRINDSRQNRDAMAILIFKNGAALRSCRRSDL